MTGPKSLFVAFFQLLVGLAIACLSGYWINRLPASRSVLKWESYDWSLLLAVALILLQAWLAWRRSGPEVRTIEDVLALGAFALCHISGNQRPKDARIRGYFHVENKRAAGPGRGRERCLCTLANYGKAPLADDGPIPLDDVKCRAWFINATAYEARKPLAKNIDWKALDSQPLPDLDVLQTISRDRHGILSYPVFDKNQTRRLGVLTFDSNLEIRQMGWDQDGTIPHEVNEIMIKTAETIRRIISHGNKD